MPNLLADRAFWVAIGGAGLNVRRLMYQPLIWPCGLRYQAGRLRPPLDLQDLQRTSNALVDGVRGYIQLERDFFGRQMLVDQTQAVELTRAQPGQAGRELRLRVLRIGHTEGGVRHPSSFRVSPLQPGKSPDSDSIYVNPAQLGKSVRSKWIKYYPDRNVSSSVWQVGGNQKKVVSQ